MINNYILNILIILLFIIIYNLSYQEYFTESNDTLDLLRSIINKNIIITNNINNLQKIETNDLESKNSILIKDKDLISKIDELEKLINTKFTNNLNNINNIYSSMNSKISKCRLKDTYQKFESRYGLEDKLIKYPWKNIYTKIPMDLKECKKHCCNYSECNFIAYDIPNKSCWMSKKSNKNINKKQEWAKGIFDCNI